jgi:paraquat-inducible protein B
MPEANPPAPEIESPQAESGWRLSAVWLVPLIALVIALGVAWKTYSERGPTIEIVLDNAAGVEAGQTTIRFRDVNVGTVESVALTPDLRRVVATARLRGDIAKYVDDSARFWVVRPSVSAQGVSGIETVISGVYIGAYWDATPGERVDRFEALPRAPLTPADQPGLRVRLRAPDGGSMTIGAPVLFKRIQVGQIEDITLTDAGDVMIDAFVRAPYSERLTTSTRFWNASGFSINLGTGGASLNVDSLISLLQGGVSFDTVGSDLTRVEDGHVFTLYGSESDARQDLLASAPGQRLLVTADFEGSVQGLAPGAKVQYRGIPVGEVSGIQAAIVEQDGEDTLTLRTTLALSPARFGVSEDTPEEMEDVALGILAHEVARGLRARLATSGILSQSLHVDLGYVADAPPATLDLKAEPHPVFPTAPSDASGLTASAEGLMKRLTDLPLEDVLDSVVALLGNVNALVASPEVKAAPENLGLLLADARKILNEPGFQEAPGELARILASVRQIVDQATEAQIVENLSGVLDETKTAVASVGTAAEGVPALLDQIDGVAAKVRALPADLRAGGAVDNVNATLASVRGITEELARAELVDDLQTVIDEARVAAVNISTVSKQAPALMDNLTALSNRVEALPLDELVDSARGVLSTADTLLASPGMADVPPKLAASLEELRATLAELRAGGAVASVNTTLTSASRAADAITTASADLPALVAQLNEVAVNADRVLATVGPNSDINRETLRVLTEVRDAVRSVNALVQALERRPNSVIFGR